MSTTIGKSNVLAARLIFIGPGRQGTGPPLLSPPVSLGDAATLLEEVKGELETKARSGPRTGLATQIKAK